MTNITFYSFAQLFPHKYFTARRQIKGGCTLRRSPSSLTPARYFSISEIERWMKSVRLLPLSMPFVSNARSMICFTSLFSPPISRSRSLRSSRSVTTFFDNSSRMDFSSG